MRLTYACKEAMLLPALQRLVDHQVVVMSLHPPLNLLIQKTQLHQQNEAGHTEEHIGPKLYVGHSNINRCHSNELGRKGA